MMKTKLLKKVFLAAALMGVGTNSAWADSTTGTLVHTASTYCTTDKTVITVTVDAEAEKYHNEGSGTYQGYAFAEFSFTIPDGATVTSATLSWSATNLNTNAARTSYVYYLNSGVTLDYTALQETPALKRMNGSKSSAIASVATAKGVSAISDETNATAAIQAMQSQGYVIFQWTGIAGGGNLNGKASANAPTLTINYTTETTYTATFTEDNSLSPTVTIYSDSERTSAVTNGSLTDGTTYYYTATLTGYNDYQGSFTVNGANPSVNFTMTAKATYNYTVKTSLGATITSGSYYEGESVTYYFPHYQLSGTDLYVKDKNASNPWYGNTFTLTTDNQEETVTYSDASVANVVYLAEAEDLMTVTSSGNTDIRCSGGKGGYSASNVEATTLAPGKYKITGAVWGNSAVTLKVVDENDNIYWSQTTNGNWLETTGDEFTLYASTTLYVVGGESSKCLDYIYIQRTGDATVSKSITSAGWATYCSPYALDFSSAITNLDAAYIVTGGSDGVLTTEAVTTTVAANTGLLLKGSEGTVTIPVVASGTDYTTTNKLVGVTASETLDANGGYVLMNEGGTVAFYKNNNDFTLTANTAYLPADFDGADARAFYSLFDSETTGVGATLVNSERVNNEVFNLQGQRVGQPTKGLYIVNGKKIVKK